MACSLLMHIVAVDFFLIFKQFTDFWRLGTER